MQKKEKERKRNDFLFVGMVLFAALLVYLWFTFGDGREGTLVQVERDGEVYAVYPLYENRTIQIGEKQDGGINILVIENGSAFVTEADCPDELCVKQKKIFRTGESIVCLPHKLVITIIGGEESEYDGFTG